MEDFQERVMVEKLQLDDRLKRLEEFIESKVFPTLTPAEQERLMHQSHLMEGYSNILGERIENF